MMGLEWITNEYDPRRDDAHIYFYFRFQGGRSKEEEWAEHQEWLRDKIISQPKALPDRTVAQLESAGMVGIYHSRSS